MDFDPHPTLTTKMTDLVPIEQEMILVDPLPQISGKTVRTN